MILIMEVWVELLPGEGFVARVWFILHNPEDKPPGWITAPWLELKYSQSWMGRVSVSVGCSIDGVSTLFCDFIDQCYLDEGSACDIASLASRPSELGVRSGRWLSGISMFWVRIKKWIQVKARVTLHIHKPSVSVPWMDLSGLEVPGAMRNLPIDRQTDRQTNCHKFSREC